ncbi:hypothetical protein EJF18_10889 [Clavispora lusitaniae]|uniref:Uncharacterized protein n=1 Tax=Clavispora lusitaniae TaxID=36911 RepID=A0ACD0WFE0_CLALS|nr:hypothetical protein EJF14_10889 [Clavispora lusitaniae]QFZ30920.1 hypothetical protein EJF16_10889 [Clavispora lusitaniae]QFZ36588.1 hypothetical protein EJF15_10889 [Clavispora lusitaniae]QFZ42272.1 hypothetical protein EJF18_10889 [Clavispora lusitaniae]QFZ47948.1 hypothetical protein EJF17_10889 [Clavispora lusitaniae]
MKRAASPSARKVKSTRTPLNQYAGTEVGQDWEVDAIETLDHFYERYIETRTPVKLIGETNLPVDLNRFRLDNIVDRLAYPEEKKLQVERKVGFGFGSGKSRELMSFAEVVEKFRKGDDSYYLTTQYAEHDVVDASNTSDTEELQETYETEDKENEAEVAKDSEAEGSENEESTEGEHDGGNGQVDFANFSDTSSLASFDVNDLHDDFDDVDSEDYVDEKLKLTTEEAEERVLSLFQPPLTELCNDTSFPITPKPFDTLIPQQINLWMGSSSQSSPKPDLLHPTKESLGKWVPNGNSSGLHHDHADNLYVLVEGRKRFTLYSPKDALNIFTVGDIDKVYANGLIDYKVNKNARLWRKMRDDGALVAEHAAWLLENEDFSTYSQQELEDLIENEEEYTGEIDDSLDPPSFSSVPPVLAHLDELTDDAEVESLTKYANEHYPGFLNLNKTQVWLEPGDMLYLPCGWFHEVTSFANEDSPAHIAMNWWFMPPNGSKASKPYKDDYWKHDYSKTLASIEYVRTK